ncbi:MAG: heparin lyase I family protein [Candidatus Cryptobacteroides sp.]
MKRMSFIPALALVVMACSGAALPGGKTDSSGENREPEPPVVPEVPGNGEGALIADGNDEATYQLILACGYNYETPDNSGAHAAEPYRHIRQSFDAELQKPVFDFWLHIENDDDRGKPNITDRQRNEIKTDSKSPEYMVAQKGETLVIKWKFKLPEGMQTTSSFSHIHQIKGIDNKEQTADVAMPLVTFTVRSLSKGGQQFQIIFNGPTGSGEGNVYLNKTGLEDFLGEWVEVEETVRFDETGTYAVKVKRISDGKQLVDVRRDGLNLWREGATGMRPKWGLYRNFGKNGANKYLLRDECLKFADFCVGKLD